MLSSPYVIKNRDIYFMFFLHIQLVIYTLGHFEYYIFSLRKLHTLENDTGRGGNFTLIYRERDRSRVTTQNTNEVLQSSRWFFIHVFFRYNIFKVGKKNIFEMKNHIQYTFRTHTYTRTCICMYTTQSTIIIYIQTYTMDTRNLSYYEIYVCVWLVCEYNSDFQFYFMQIFLYIFFFCQLFCHIYKIEIYNTPHILYMCVDVVWISFIYTTRR